MTRGYGATGILVGPSFEYLPIRHFGIGATVCYINDAYLFFSSYRVGGAFLSVDATLEYCYASLSAGPNLDFYSAPVVESRFYGWHAGLGWDIIRTRHWRLSLQASYVNRVDPAAFGLAMRGWPDLSPLDLLFCSIPKLGGFVQLSFRPGA